MAQRKSEVTIYHNPACATSRKVLGMIRDAGTEPHVIEYLKTPPTRPELVDLLRRGTPYQELGLDDPEKSDDELIDAILAHPILMERPVVVGPGGVRLCRPPERVREVLPAH
jgi:arsenate reductase (glutaredoxin)